MARQKSDKTEQVLVRMTPVQKEKLLEMAGDVPLGQWLLDKAFEPEKKNVGVEEHVAYCSSLGSKPKAEEKPYVRKHHPACSCLICKPGKEK